MGDFDLSLQEEKEYLNKTVSVIKEELKRKTKDVSDKKQKLIDSKRDMWENTAHHSRDFAKLTEISQYLTEVNRQAANYHYTVEHLAKLERMITSPYFGRFDFVEDGCAEVEKIYLGFGNVRDPKTFEMYVYDWRAPISSMYYRYEPGRASFTAPSGEISGEVLLKRQYKIKDSRLEYFFDSSITINDEILQQILGRNASPKMRNIVETIQKEQDVIIRDTENQLLIVQGVAGSGKTSIALHRIAFLLYEGIKANLKSDNVIIISPNTVFSKYISGVLPELGEEKVAQTTFYDILQDAFQSRFHPGSRESQLECIIANNDSTETIRNKAVIFKASRTFGKILDRAIRHYAHRIIPFQDIYFEGQILFTKQQLKNRFLNNKTNMPMAKQLKRIESLIMEKIHPLQKAKLKKIEAIVANDPEHQFEIKPYSRLIAIKSLKPFLNLIYRFTRVDYMDLYKSLFSEPRLLVRLAEGLELPDRIEQIISETNRNLELDRVEFEDAAPLLYLKLKLEGSDLFREIRQVVIDEAQDYYPLHYEIFKILFKDAKYTVLGDVQQSIEKPADLSLYDDILEILDKEKSVKLYLNKGYRSSYEISQFTRNLQNKKQEFIPFERHEQEPIIQHKKTILSTDKAVVKDIAHFIKEGYESVAVICKTQKEAEEVYSRIVKFTNVKLIKPNESTMEKGIQVIASYLAKGLEFDAVIIYNASKEKYSTDLDKNLLYVACTRALHRLAIYHIGEISPFLQFAKRT